MMNAILLAGLVLVGPAGPQETVGPPFQLAARLDRLFGGTDGTLVFDEDALEFRATDPDDVRRWAYADLKQLRILSRSRVVVDTYEDQGRLRLGRDRSFTFDLDAPVTSGLVAFLLERVDRPVVMAVPPPLPLEARFQVPVRHARAGKGSEGALKLYDEGVAYSTEQEGDARFWRFRDLFSVLALDPYRLEVRAYEGGPGETRPFTFELKTTLPAGMYDALWQHVNAPVTPKGGPLSTRLGIVASVASVALAGGVVSAQAPAVDHALHHAARPKAAVTLATDPAPSVAGENTFTVTLKHEDGRPLVGASVEIVLVMPATAGMGEMRNKVILDAADDPEKAADGVYTGKGQIFMAGDWNATVAIEKDGQASRKRN